MLIFEELLDFWHKIGNLKKSTKTRQSTHRAYSKSIVLVSMLAMVLQYFSYPLILCKKKASAKSKIVFYLLRSYRWSLNLVYCKWRDAERPCVFCRHWALDKSSAALRTSFLGWLGTAFNLIVRIRSQTL